MNRKSLVLLVLLAVLGLGTWWLIQRRAHSGTTLDTAETAFAVPDTAAVDKVFVAFKDGGQHTVRRVARSYWRLDERYDVRPEQINTLLQTLARMSVKSPVARAARNTVVRDLATKAIKVEVYQHGALARTFYVGGTTEDQTGTFAILAGAETPYILHIPGFEGFLTTRFLVNNQTWRTVPIFRIPMAQLVKVEVETPGQPEQSFRLSRPSPGVPFALEGMPRADSTSLHRYATLYSRINGMFFLETPDRATFDSLLHTPPHHIVRAFMQGAPRPERIRLWVPKGSKNLLVGITDRDSAEVLLTQQHVFGNLLLTRTALATNSWIKQ